MSSPAACETEPPKTMLSVTAYPIVGLTAQSVHATFAMSPVPTYQLPFAFCAFTPNAKSSPKAKLKNNFFIIIFWRSKIL